MDTMTVTKGVAAICSAWLVLLLGAWAAEGIYHMDSHGEQSYVIDTGAEEVASNEPEVSFEDLMAAADAGKGEKVFKKCGACHKIEDGVNSTGPSLYGVVGRDIAGVDGFGYSGAMAAVEGDWTAERLSAFLEKPSAYVSGTSMSFAGLKKPADRVNLIAYLDSLDD